MPDKIPTRVYIARNVFTILCPEGARLRKNWLDALENRSESEAVYQAMKAYFVHRNGMLTKNYGKIASLFCSECTPYTTEIPK